MSDGAPISQEIRLPTNTDEIGKAVKKLDEMMARIAKLEKVGEHHRKSAEEGFKGIGKSISEAHERLRGFAEFTGLALLAEGAAKVAEKFADIGREALHSAANAQRMNFALNASAGGEKGGEKVRKWIEENAKFSEFTEEQNESAFLNLRRFGVSQNKAGLYMKAAEDLAAVSAPGEREGVYQEALSSFARLHAKGRLDTRSAMRLGIGVEDLKTLPGYKGLSNQKVSEKAEQSNLDENTLFALIMKHTGEKGIGEKSADASALLSTKLTKLGELPERYFKQLGEGEGSERMTEALDKLLNRLDPSTEQGKKFTGALQSVFKELASDIEPVTILIEKTVGAMEKLVRVAGMANNVLHDWTPLGLLEDKISGSVEKSAGLGEIKLGERMPKNFDYQVARAQLHGERQIDSTKVNLYTGGAASDGLAAGMKRHAPAVDEAASDLGERAEKATKTKLKIHSPSRVFENLGKMTGEGFGLGLRSSELGDLFDSTFRLPMPTFTSAAMARGNTHLEITVNVTPVSGQDPNALGETVAQAVRREVTNLLERTADE